MKTKLVKDVMIPIENYVTINKDATILELFRALEASKTTDRAHAHRDAVVLDQNGDFYGKVTMTGIFRVLEPNYSQVNMDAFIEAGRGRLTEEMFDAYKDFDLWVEPSKDICERSAASLVSEAVHVPESNEYIQESDSVERALHLYVMGAAQPLVVKDGDKVTGLLRFGDVFEVVREDILSCALEE